VRKLVQFSIAVIALTAVSLGEANPAAARRKATTTTTLRTTTTTAVSSTTTTTVPGSSGHFATLPPGAALPSDGTCAAQVRPKAEQRPENNVANHTVPPAGSFTLGALGSNNGYDSRSQQLQSRVTGNFTGTTDEILQWASCKWGWDEDVVRAIAVTESYWQQSQLGDYQTTGCPPGYSSPCPMSFGIHQVKWSDDPTGSFPWSKDSTAFNLDVSMFVHRLCYEGFITWLYQYPGSTTPYRVGDLWGCVGQWYSGRWWDAGARDYISTVQKHLSTKPWTQSSFSSAPTTTTTTTPSTTTTTIPGSTTTCPCLRYGFDDGTTQGWYPAWGPIRLSHTTSPVHSGTGALALTLSPTGANWPAVQLSSPPGLTSGMSVTYWLHQPEGAQLTNVQPYVADLNWNDVFAPPTVLTTGWNKVTWVVPAVDGIKGIGVVFNDDAGWNGQMVLDSVSW
jgi:hypothetical protein